MARNRAAYRYLAYRRRKRNGHGAPKLLMAAIILGGLAMFGIFVLFTVTYGIYQSYADDLLPPDEVIAKQPSGGARILDRNGNKLYEFLDDTSGLREPIKIEDISFYLVLGTVATEDSTFFENPGVNFNGLAAAAWENFSPFGKTPGFLEGRGGSSITQQLVKNIYFTPEQRAERSISRKIKETVYALELTRRYAGSDEGSDKWRAGKRQILEWYLNSISYGNVFVGIQAASQGYFGVDARDLTLPQAALLAAIPACPSCYDPFSDPVAATEQRNIVLRRMYEEHYIDAVQLIDAVASPLELSPRGYDIRAPHFVFNIVQPQLEQIFGAEALKRDGLIVYTTLDSTLQDTSQAILNNWIETYEYSGGHNGAVVAIDPNNAQILSYVGSRDYFNEDILGQNDMAGALNSPGSSIKPVTYVTAFQELGWGPGTLILDQPIPSEYWDGKNPPRNPVPHSGPISARDALGNSLNIPAIKVILSVGVNNVIEQGKRMGLTTLDDRDFGPSLTVGGVDVKLVDMVYAYTAFPNLGIQKGIESTVARPPGNRALDPISILRVTDRSGKVLYPVIGGEPAQEPAAQEVRVVEAAESYEINSILSDLNAHCLTYGCGALSIGRPAAFKTGTSEPYEESRAIGETWTFGWTPQLVVGSWFGNADNTPMYDISSYNVSFRATRDILAEYVKDKPVQDFVRPDGLVKAVTCIPSGMKPSANCPIRSKEDWLARPPTQDDTWWQVQGNRRVLNVPPEITGFRRDDAFLWQGLPGVAPSPTPEATPEGPQVEGATVAITSPLPGGRIDGVVPVAGTATSEHFESYLLEYQSDANPRKWTVIGQGNSPVTNGILGSWDTRSLPSGVYVLRLLVTDEEAGQITADIRVVVFGGRGNGGG